MSAFAVDLDDELREVGRTRVNALPSTVGERAAALRYRLDRVDRNHCDGLTTPETPGFAAGVPVEVKSVRVEHHDGTGRLAVHPESHARLVDEGGVYVVVLYAEVEQRGRRIVVLACEIVAPETVGRFIPADPSGYAKVRWDLLLDDVDVDRSRWSR